MAGHRFRTMPRENTTARGYGAEHKQARKQAAAAHHPSDPCSRCGRPLGPMGPWLHLDHTADRTSYLGFSHGVPCNVTAGARAGRARQNVTRLKW
jgi:hypothetical protein